MFDGKQKQATGRTHPHDQSSARSIPRWRPASHSTNMWSKRRIQTLKGPKISAGAIPSRNIHTSLKKTRRSRKEKWDLDASGDRCGWVRAETQMCRLPSPWGGSTREHHCRHEGPRMMADLDDWLVKDRRPKEQDHNKYMTQFGEYLLLHSKQRHLSFKELSTALMDAIDISEYRQSPFYPIIYHCENVHHLLFSMISTPDWVKARDFFKKNILTILKALWTINSVSLHLLQSIMKNLKQTQFQRFFPKYHHLAQVSREGHKYERSNRFRVEKILSDPEKICLSTAASFRRTIIGPLMGKRGSNQSSWLSI